MIVIVLAAMWKYFCEMLHFTRHQYRSPGVVGLCEHFQFCHLLPHLAQIFLLPPTVTTLLGSFNISRYIRFLSMEFLHVSVAILECPQTLFGRLTPTALASAILGFPRFLIAGASASLLPLSCNICVLRLYCHSLPCLYSPVATSWARRQAGLQWPIGAGICWYVSFRRPPPPPPLPRKFEWTTAVHPQNVNKHSAQRIQTALLEAIGFRTMIGNVLKPDGSSDYFHQCWWAPLFAATDHLILLRALALNIVPFLFFCTSGVTYRHHQIFLHFGNCSLTALWATEGFDKGLVCFRLLPKPFKFSTGLVTREHS